MNTEEANQETLECARYGEEDDLRALLMSPGVTANYADDMGTTALHRAAANGEVGCLKILKEFGALHSPNAQGNFPTHWAALNGKVESLRFLFESYDVDVLAKNAAGRSTLTEAFQSQKPEVIEICLSHSSASEENLMKMDPGTDAKVTMDGGGDAEDDSQNLEKHAVFHFMDFTQSSFYGNQIGVQRKVVRVRELPISRADNPFGSETAPQDDTTGLGLWPAAVLLSRWVVQQHASLRGKVVIELGAGCGLPGLAAAVCCGPKSVYVTDIHDPTLSNAAFNARLNAAENGKSESDKMHVESQEGNLLFEDVVVDSAALVGASSSSDIAGQLNSVTLNDGNTTVFQAARATASASSAVKTQLKVTKVSWSDPSTFPPEKADVLIGSDLVYDSRILTLLTAAVDGMLAPDGVFLYVAPNECRDGIDGLIGALASVGLKCVLQQQCPEWMYENPLVGDDSEEAEEGASSTAEKQAGKLSHEQEQNQNQKQQQKQKHSAIGPEDSYVLHFYDLSARKPHTMYKFMR